MLYTKRLLILFIWLSLSGAGILVPRFVKADVPGPKDCGGATTCACGDSVISDYTLTGNLSCSGNGLIIKGNSITINGGGYTISGNGEANYGIYNNSGYDNVTLTNLTISNFKYGVYLNTSTGWTVNSIQVDGKNINISEGISLNDSSSNSITNSTSTSSFYGIKLDNNSNSNTVTGNQLKFCEYGLYINFSDSNTLNNNTVTYVYSRGLFITMANNTIISNNTIEHNAVFGIYMELTTGSTVSSNNINFNGLAWLFDTTDSDTVDSNILLGNNYDDYDFYDYESNTNLIFTNNQLTHQATTSMVVFTEIDRTIDLSSTVNFNIAMKNFDDYSACNDCAYTLATTPTETVTVNKTDNNLAGSFTPSKNGTYTLSAQVTDSDGNVTKKNFMFIVGDTAATTTRFYLRGINPSHGQPLSRYNGADAKSINSVVPTTTEIWYCGAWIQNTLDGMPDYFLADLTQVDIYNWYKLGSTGNIKLERLSFYESTGDLSSSIAASTPYKENTTTFSNINWMTEYQRNWYWLAVKLAGTNPYWRTSSTQPAYVDFTYSYSTKPAVKSNSNDKVLLTAATETTTDHYSIVLENPFLEATTTTVTLGSYNKPFSSYTSTIGANNTTAVTSASITNGGTSTLDLAAVNLLVTPSTGSVDVSISTWNTTGDYSKQWTETSSDNPTVTHTVGDLVAGESYQVAYAKSAGTTLLTKATANNSGQITFTYDKGFSTVTFYITQDAPITNTGASLPISNSGSVGPLPTFPQLTTVTTSSSTLSITSTSSIIITTPAFVTYLYKSPSSTQVYLITPTNYKYHLPNEQTFLSYGYTWDQITTIPSVQLNTYPTSTLIKLLSDPKVYLIQNNQKHWIINESVFNALNFSWSAITTVNTTDFNSYLSGADIISPQGLVKAATTYQFTTNLSLGSLGTEVRQLQTKLKTLGFYTYPYITGYYGSITQQAVKAFQKAHNLKVTGTLGPQTREVLNTQ